MCQGLLWVLGTQNQGRPAPLEMDTETWDRCGPWVKPSGPTGLTSLRETAPVYFPLPRAKGQGKLRSKHWTQRAISPQELLDNSALRTSYQVPSPLVRAWRKASPSAQGGQLLMSQLEKTWHPVGVDTTSDHRGRPPSRWQTAPRASTSSI